jgi:acyl transferase domain-containing protein
VSASEISYIEAHGTATMIGDPIELKALTRTFSNYTDKKQFCGIGSVKTNIGHLLSAAGISAFIKTALCIYHKELVPTLNCTVPNPRFDFKNSPFFPVLSAVPWRTENGRLYAGISSFGFGGTNAHIVLSNFDEKSHNEYKCIRERKPKSIFDKKRYFIDDTSKNGILIQKDKTDLPKRELSILNLID